MNSTCTTREVAQMLGMAVRSIQMMVDRGDLEAWKTPGGHRRISRTSLDRWCASRGVVLTETPPEDGAKPPRRGPAVLRRQGAQVAPAGRGSPRSGAALVPATHHATSAPRVLLIEDSVHYQHLVSLLVQQQFPQVHLHIADDGIAGLALAGQLRPQVLVVDILLPGIDGAMLITSLRSHPQFAATRLIVVTSLDEAQREPYAFALADVPVVHKPRLVLDLPPLLRQRLLEADSEPGQPQPLS